MSRRRAATTFRKPRVCELPQLHCQRPMHRSGSSTSLRTSLPTPFGLGLRLDRSNTAFLPCQLGLRPTFSLVTGLGHPQRAGRPRSRMSPSRRSGTPPRRRGPNSEARQPVPVVGIAQRNRPSRVGQRQGRGGAFSAGAGAPRRRPT
jgi:hypothetical protein